MSIINEKSLTPKESEVVRLLVQGKRRKEIAYALGISKGTIDTHCKRIYQKLNTNSMAETAVWGVRNGYGEDD